MERIFTWVWRLNGLILFFGSLAIFGLIIFEFAVGGSRVKEDSPVLTTVAEDPDGVEQWGLGDFQTVWGTEYSYMRLISENNEIKSRSYSSSPGIYASGGRSRNPAKNVLFINRDTDEMKWLFESVDQLITSMWQLPDRDYRLPSNEEQDKTEILLYKLKINDSNNDSLINQEDSSSLAFTYSNGSGYQIIIEGYEKIISSELLKGNILSIIYQSSGSAYSAKYSLEPFTEISNVVVPKISE